MKNSVLIVVFSVYLMADIPMCYLIYRVSQEEWTKLRESVPYVKIYRYNPKHLYPKLNGYGDNGQRSLKL
jgi:hypothetical protein